MLELLVTLIVLAVLTAVGVPSLREFLVRSQLSAAAGEIHAAVARARQEAITRGTFVSVRPLTGSSWANGYQIFVNPLNAATFTVGQSVGNGTSVVTSEVIAKRDPPNLSYVTWPSLTSDGKTPRDYYTFDDTGRPRNASAGYMSSADPQRVRVCGTGSNCRELLVDHLGRIQILKN